MSALTGGIELAPLLTRIAVDLDSFKTEMEKAKEVAKTQADGISQQIKKAAQVGQNLQKVGGTLTKAITVPLMGAGAASAKFAMDFQKDMAQVKTLLDGNAQQVEARTKELSKNVLQVSNDVNMSSSQIAEGTYQVISAYGDSAETMDLVTIAAKGAKAGGAELVDSVNLLSAVTKGYGDTSKEANEKVSDLAFQTVKLGQTTFPELASSMGRVVPLAATLKVSQEELFGIMATGTGVTGNAAEVSTQLRGVLQALMAPTDSMAELMANLGYESGQAMIEGLGLQGTIDAIVKAADESGMPLQSYIGSIEGQTLALTLSGEQSDVLREKIAAMGEATGSAAKAFKAATDNEAEDFDGSINKLKNSAIAFGDALTPLISKVADLVSGVADFINDLSPAQKEMAVNFALVAAAAGPAISTVGKGITTFSNVAGALKGLGGAASTAAGAGGLGALTPALGGIASAALPIAGTIAGVAAAGYGLYKVLDQSVVPEVDLFETRMIDANGNILSKTEEATAGVYRQAVVISDSTKQAVSAYMDMDTQVGDILLGMKVDNAVMTQATADELSGIYDNMAKTITDGLNASYEQDKQDFQKYVVEKGLLSEDEQKQAAQILEQGHADRIAKVSANTARLKEIDEEYKTASVQRQKELDEERRRIMDENASLAIIALSDSEAEAAAIQQTWADNHVEVTAQMASEQVKRLNDARDQKILSAQQEYTQQMDIARQLREQGGAEAEALADKIEQEATAQKDAVIQKANETRDQGINNLRQSYKDLEHDIDTTTGDIQSHWDKLTFPVKKMRVEIETSQKRLTDQGYGSLLASSGSLNYTGLSYVPYDGYNIIAHKGERVLTAEENRDYMQAKNGGGPNGGNLGTLKAVIKVGDRELANAIAPLISEEQGFAL